MIDPNDFDDDDVFELMEQKNKKYIQLRKSTKSLSDFLIASANQLKKIRDDFVSYTTELYSILHISLYNMFKDENIMISRGTIITFLENIIDAIKEKKIHIEEHIIDNLCELWISRNGNDEDKLIECFNNEKVNEILFTLRNFKNMHDFIEYYGKKWENSDSIDFNEFFGLNYTIFNYFIMDIHQCNVIKIFIEAVLLDGFKFAEDNRITFPKGLLNEVEQWLKNLLCKFALHLRNSNSSEIANLALTLKDKEDYESQYIYSHCIYELRRRDLL